jgi:hypothetical protein
MINAINNDMIEQYNSLKWLIENQHPISFNQKSNDFCYYRVITDPITNLFKFFEKKDVKINNTKWV